MKFSTQEEQLMFIGLCVVGGLFLVACIRILVLRRRERKLLDQTDTLEAEIRDQQQQIMVIRQESNTWRTEMQRQFDAFRSDATRRYGEAELRSMDIQKRFDTATEQHERRTFELQASLDAARRMCSELPTAKARIIELEKMLTPDHSSLVSSNGSINDREMKSLAAATKAVSNLPVLPSMEALQSQPAESAVPSELAEVQQRNAELQRALLLARRRKPQLRKPRTRQG